MKKLSQTKNYWLVENTADIEAVIKKVASFDVVAFDTETSGLNVRREKVIGYSLSVNEGEGYYIPIFTWDGTTLTPLKIVGTKKLLEVLSDKKLVMHNASFDCRIVYNFIKVDLLSNLHADTMLMMHTLNEEGPFGLKEISLARAKDIGFTTEDVANQEQVELEENVKANGGVWKKTEKEIYKADLDVLAKYACADTDLTLRLYNLFSKELKQQELHNFFYQDEVMPLYKKVTIPMEQYGVHLDMPKLQRLSAEIKEDIAAIETKLVTDIIASPEGQEFLSRRCEDEVGRKVSGGFAQAIAEYYELPLPKNDNGKFSITAKTVKSLEEGPGKLALETKSAEHLPEDVIKEIQLSILKKDGPLFNLSSKQQLGTLIFDIMGVEPLSKTEKGAPQFNEDMIEHLAEKNIVSWAKELRVYNKLVKISGSSYERFLEEQDDGVFYPYYKQHGTTSGRYSSNVQQLPRPIEGNEEDARIIKYNNEIRALFISNPGYVFIDDDYASLEPSVFAHDASDQPLIDIFVKGEDFYSKVAIMALGLDASADKKSPKFLKNINPKARQDAKAYALGIRYGAEEGKVSQLLEIEKEDAKVIVDNYFSAFPKLKAKMDQYKKQAKEKGIVRSEFGRVRHLPVAKEIYDYFGDDILDYSKLYDLCKKARMSFQELKDIRRTYKNLLNNALNFPIQSAATTVINRAVIAVTDEFQQKGIDGWVCGIIHDQAIYCVKEEQKEIAAEIVQRCMEQTTKLKVPLYAVPQFSVNFRDGH